MARRGFFAEMQHQAKVAAREAERAQRQGAQAHAAALREAERTHKAAERAAAQAARSSEAERKRLEKEARDAHVAAMQAEVEERNTGLAQRYDEIDSLLAATLAVDDHVDLEELRSTVEHPPFDRAALENPAPPPAPLLPPPEPTFTQPDPPKGMFGKKKKHDEAVAAARVEYAQAHDAWEREVASIPARAQSAQEHHAANEKRRVEQLAAERERYDAECAEREAEVAAQNAELDELIVNLGYGATDAVEEYIGIVLSNSVYPEHFPVSHEFTFNPDNAELSLRVLVPGPDQVPAIKGYKYVKADDAIVESPAPPKAVKDRYASAVHQVALRSLHEVFEADRRGIVKSIALEVGTETIDPATGVQTYVPFVAAGADRDTFTSFDLSAVVPAATLDHLGAAVSKNPHALVPAVTTGVRRS